MFALSHTLKVAETTLSPDRLTASIKNSFHNSSPVMLRSIRFLSATLAEKDRAGLVLLALILATIAWTLSIIFSPTMRDMAMERFHLGSDNFAIWAAHQSVPSMYNFENQIQFSNELLGAAPFDPTDPTYTKRTVNHFPSRFVTFGDRTINCFSKRRQGTFEMRSTFGDIQLVTRWELQQPGDPSKEPTDIASPAPMIVRRISKRWESVAGGGDNE